MRIYLYIVWEVVGVTDCQYEHESVYARPLSYSSCDRIKMAECPAVKKERAVDTANGTAFATIRYTPVHFF